MSREHPWNMRRVTHRHLHDHQNLLDLHLLTHAWEPQGAARVYNPFERDPSLEDDTSPEDVLARLELGVRAAQLQTMRSARKSGTPLAERSWTAGRECSAKRWDGAPGAGRSEDPSKQPLGPSDKRLLIVALYHSPLSSRLGPGAFLVRRARVAEVSVELLQCPHRQLHGSDEAPEVVDELCSQQFHWLRGYLHHLDPALTPELARDGARCVVSW